MRRHLGPIALLAVCAVTASAAMPSQKLARARAEFERGEYKSVVSTLEPELYPRTLILDEDELKEARYLLGVSFFFLRRTNDARRELTQLLFLDPERKLDSATEDPEVIEFFEGVKGQLRSQLEEIRKQKQREAEARRLPSREVLVERTIRPPPSPLTNFLPFGYGQFRNGQPVKGALFLGTQVLAGGASLALFTYQAVTYGLPSHYSDPADGDRIRRLQLIQVATGAVFLVAYGWSVIDSFVSQKPRVEERRTERPILPAASSSRLELVPLVGPGVAGAQAVWRF